MSVNRPANGGATRLAAGKLNTFDIVFFVVSAAAPLTVAVSSAPFSFRFGGLGAPGAMLASGIVLILFAAGLTAMSRYISNAGAFYAYAVAGLGKPVGIGVAFITIVAYAFLCICFYALLGFFAHQTFADLLDINLHWSLWSIIAVILVAILGYRRVDVGAKVLAVLLTAEVAILLLISIAEIIEHPGNLIAATQASLNPHAIFLAKGSSALFVFGFGAFLGFEGTVIYVEEARQAHKTIPRATYIAIAFLAIFYAITFWALTVAFGNSGILAVAHGDDYDQMMFIAGRNALGNWAGHVIEVLIITSFFACVLAFHNACSRYLFSLAREGLIPRLFSHTHSRMHSPHKASIALSLLSLCIIVLGALFKADPMLGIGLWSYAIGVAGLVFAQGLAAISVIGFFLRDRRGYSAMRVVIAPILGAIGLLSAFLVMIFHFDLVSGIEGVMNWVMVAVVPLVFLLGIVVGLLLKYYRPQHYLRLAQSISQETVTEPNSP